MKKQTHHNPPVSDQWKGIEDQPGDQLESEAEKSDQAGPAELLAEPSPWFSGDTDFDPFASEYLTDSNGETKHRWAVSWSDLMMTMFILFTVMFIYQAGQRELKFGSGPGDNTISEAGSDSLVDVTMNKKPSDIFDQTREAFKDEWVDDTVSVDLVKDQAVRISIAGDLFFDVGKADLKLQARYRLRQIAELILENVFIVNVVGHTDSTPNHSEQFPTNWELSTARACRVARYLIEEGGISEDRFLVTGHSWHQPVKPNNTAYNRSLNRRVEIILMKERPYAEPVPLLTEKRL